MAHLWQWSLNLSPKAQLLLCPSCWYSVCTSGEAQRSLSSHRRELDGDEFNLLLTGDMLGWWISKSADSRWHSSLSVARRVCLNCKTVVCCVGTWWISARFVGRVTFHREIRSNLLWLLGRTIFKFATNKLAQFFQTPRHSLPK